MLDRDGIQCLLGVSGSSSRLRLVLVGKLGIAHAAGFVSQGSQLLRLGYGGISLRLQRLDRRNAGRRNAGSGRVDRSNRCRRCGRGGRRGGRGASIINRRHKTGCTQGGTAGLHGARLADGANSTHHASLTDILAPFLAVIDVGQVAGNLLPHRLRDFLPDLSQDILAGLGGTEPLQQRTRIRIAKAGQLQDLVGSNTKAGRCATGRDGGHQRHFGGQLIASLLRRHRQIQFAVAGRHLLQVVGRHAFDFGFGLCAAHAAGDSSLACHATDSSGRHGSLCGSSPRSLLRCACSNSLGGSTARRHPSRHGADSHAGQHDRRALEHHVGDGHRIIEQCIKGFSHTLCLLDTTIGDLRLGALVGFLCLRRFQHGGRKAIRINARQFVHQPRGAAHHVQQTLLAGNASIRPDFLAATLGVSLALLGGSIGLIERGLVLGLAGLHASASVGRRSCKALFLQDLAVGSIRRIGGRIQYLLGSEGIFEGNRLDGRAGTTLVRLGCGLAGNEAVVLRSQVLGNDGIADLVSSHLLDIDSQLVAKVIDDLLVSEVLAEELKIKRHGTPANRVAWIRPSLFDR